MIAGSGHNWCSRHWGEQAGCRWDMSDWNTFCLLPLRRNPVASVGAQVQAKKVVVVKL